MRLEVTAITMLSVSRPFQVQADTIPEAFALIPSKAADMGFALINDGSIVSYKVAVIDNA